MSLRLTPRRRSLAVLAAAVLALLLGSAKCLFRWCRP